MTGAAIAKKLGGPPVLRRTISSDLEFVEALEDGFPVQAVDEIVGNGSMTLHEVYALVIPRRTLSKRRRLGQKLTPEESDRLARLARMLQAAEETFGDREKAHNWLRRPNRGLDGKIPLPMLATDAGARVVEQALGRIRHGIFA
jgi:putative toxin-antitoxin system antitoxin component (TIGR02293 family)